jgi:hypothetical protein
MDNLKHVTDRMIAEKAEEERLQLEAAKKPPRRSRPRTPSRRPSSRSNSCRSRLRISPGGAANHGQASQWLNDLDVPYFVFWTSPFDSTLIRTLRMESVQQGAAVQLTIPDVGVFQIPIVRRPLPRRGGSSIFYRCPGCGQPRRYLYLRSLVIGRLVDYQGPLCQACAGLRWASQGRYIGVFHRGFPLPRHPRDPRAVSDPRLILDEFPDLVGDRELVPGPD